MDDPTVARRLEDSIHLSGPARTCVYASSGIAGRGTTIFSSGKKWAVKFHALMLTWLGGTNRVDHKRAVKKFDRIAGSAACRLTCGSLRFLDVSFTGRLTRLVAQKTLNYLFLDLIPRRGFSTITCAFVRDRSRAVWCGMTLRSSMTPAPRYGVP